MHRPIAAFLLCAMLAALLALPATPARAAGNITVNTTADSTADNGQCSLREAMQKIVQPAQPYNDDCPAASSPATITFSVSGTIKLILNDVLPNVNTNIAITGPIIIDGNKNNIFDIDDGGILSLANLTVTKGSRAVTVNAGGTFNAAGVSFVGNAGPTISGMVINATGGDTRVNIAGSNFTGNKSPDGSGGAILVGAIKQLNIAGSVFNGNTAKFSGGAIVSLAPTNITDVIFNGNIAQGDDGDDEPADEGGGAIFFQGDDKLLTITRSVFNGNLSPKGSGAALYLQNGDEAPAQIRDSSFNGNIAGTPSSAERLGGAILNLGGFGVIQRSVFLNNAVAGDGGAIANDRRGELTIANSTLVANAATGEGAGLFNNNTQSGGATPPTAILLNVTLALNAAAGSGGGIFSAPANSQNPEPVRLGNTIISGSDGGGLGGNCVGPITSRGGNLDSGASCALGGTGDQSSADAKLEAPKFNGGALAALLSMKLLPGSAALSAGNSQLCADPPVGGEDQRGTARSGPGCDSGAYEGPAAKPGYGSTPVQPGPLLLGNAVVGSTASGSLSVFNTGDAPLIVSAATLGGPSAAEFAVIGGLPATIAPGAPAVSIQLQCTPTAIGARNASVSLSTNDPALPAVGYSLLCNGTATPAAGFGSTPAAPSPLNVGQVVLGQSKPAALGVSETGNAALSVSSATLGGANPGDFSVAGAPLNIADGGAPQALSITCTPTALGVRTASLTLATNDPARPSVALTLTCKGVPVPQNVIALPGQSIGTNIFNGSAGPYGIAISPDGRHVYATDQGDDTVTLFSRNPVTGNLTREQVYTDGGIAETLDGAWQVKVSPDGANVYVTSAGDDALTAFARNQETGELMLLDSVTNGDQYGCFPLPCDGTVPLFDPYDMIVSPDGQFIYVSAAGSDAVVIFRRSTLDGGIVTPTPLPLGPNLRQIYQPNDASLINAPYGMALSPDGGYLYVSALSSSTLLAFKRDASSGLLNTAPTRYGTSGPQGAPELEGAFRVAVSPDGAYLYVVSADLFPPAGNAVVAYARNQSTGQLTLVDAYSEGENGIDGLGLASSVTVSADGHYLFTTGFGDDATTIFARDAATGELRQEQVIKRDGAGQPPLDGANGLVEAPGGRHLYVTAFSDNRVVMLPLANPQPRLSSLEPASRVAASAASEIIVFGADFVEGAVVRLAAANLATTFLSSGKLRAVVPAGLGAALGTRPVTVLNPAPGGGVSNELPFTISLPADNPVPSVTAAIPGGVAAGGTPFTLTVDGSGFLPSSVVRWNGQDRPTVYVGTGTLQASISAADIAQPGPAGITVFNPAPGGGLSNAATVEVAAPGENPAPSLTSLTPASAPQGTATETTVTVLGSGFIAGSVARVNGQDRPTDLVSATELRVAISAADLVTPGSVSVTVFNPAPGGGESNVGTFTVLAPGENPVPSLLAAGGAVRNADGSVTLSVSGAGFIGSSVARWNGQDRPTSVGGEGQLTITIAQADFAAGSGLISVANPGPGGGASEELLFLIRRVAIPMLRR